MQDNQLELFSQTPEQETIGGYRVHPAASVFPMMNRDEFNDLLDTIRTNGVQHPIVVYGDVLLDGRNRLRAVERLRSEGWTGDCPVEQWKDDGRNIAQWISDTNLSRRHLGFDAIAFASAALYTRIAAENAERKKAGLKRGNEHGRAGKDSVRTNSTERDHKAEDSRSTAGQIAAKAGVSLHKAKQAIAVHKAVAAGELPAETVPQIMAGEVKLREVAPKPAKRPENKPAATVVDHSGRVYKVHPVLAVIPDMTPAEMQGLIRSIKEIGLKNYPVTWNGILIDGRQRIEACRRLRFDPQTSELDSDEDPVSYIISANILRAHYTPEQIKQYEAAAQKLRERSK